MHSFSIPIRRLATLALGATLFVLCAAVARPAAAQASFSCSFSNSPTDCGFSEQAAGARASLVSTARDGSTAVRLTTQPGDSNIAGSGTNERDDLTLSVSASGCAQGNERWYAHSIYFPSDYVVPPSGSTWHWGIVFDFHHTGSTGQPNFEIVSIPTGLELWVAGGATEVQGPGPGLTQTPIGPVVKNQWYDFVYHVKWSSSSDGYFQATLNGIPVMNYAGPTLYAGEQCYMKLANYHTPISQSVSVIHDRVMVATTQAGLGTAGGGGGTVADTTPPSVPGNLAGTAVSSSEIGLTWSAATDNVAVTGYYVYLNDAILAQVTGTSYQHKGLIAGTTYNYRVSSYDAAANNSAWTAAPVAVTTKAAVTADTTARSTPSGLGATAMSSSQINLAWAASTDNVGVTGYKVYRNGTLFGILGAVQTIQDSSLAAATRYTYTVQAVDAGGNASAQSTAVSATTLSAIIPDITPPSVPPNLVGMAVSPTQVNLSWGAATDNVAVTGYYVYLNNAILAQVTGTSYQHTGLTAGSAYNYRVSSFDAAGNNSAWTATPLAVTTPAVDIPPVADTTPPSVPTGLRASNVTTDSITLSWKPSTDNVGVAGYDIYLNDVLIATSPTTSFIHSRLARKTNYRYRVSAHDAVPNYSAWTSALSVTTKN